MYLPTIRQLQYLVAVTDLQHFGRAAERCHVTQSTLSAGIRELETVLGADLVERTKRRVAPTLLGERIVGKARALLDIAHDIAETTAAAEAPLTGDLRFGVIPTIGPFVLPRALAGLRAAYPNLKLYLREGQTADLLERLRRNELEVALIALPYAVDEFASMALGDDPFWVALPAGHALAKRKSIAAEALPADELLLLEAGHCLRDHALNACALSASGEAAAFQATSLYTLFEMVANGLGITLLPEIAVTAGVLRHAEVDLRPLRAGAARRSLGLVWRKSYRRDADIAALGTYLRGRLAGMRFGKTV